MTTQAKVKQVIELMAELEDIKKRNMKYALIDLHTWMEKRLDQVAYLLDEVQDELDPEYPDQQLIMNAEMEVSV